MRIVSLLPSATEIVCAVGLRDSLVGVTHECDHPVGVSDLPVVTQTLIPQGATSREIDELVRERLTTDRALYRLDMPVLRSLEPDLIVTQTLCDVCAVAADEVMDAVCHLPGAPRVVNLEPMTLDEVLDAVMAIGEAAGRQRESMDVVARLRARIAAVVARTSAVPMVDRPRVAFLEWIDPPFNGGHWNPQLVELAGGTDALGAPGAPSRRLAWEEVVAARPDVVFVSCCGFTVERALQDLPLLTTLPEWDDLPAAANGRVYVSDGNAFFSRAGPRLVDSLEILAHALHPEAHPAPAHPARSAGVPRAA